LLARASKIYALPPKPNHGTSAFHQRAASSQELINELQDLFTRHNALDALNVTESIKPVPEFHVARHLILTPQENLALNELCPIVAMVKTKGRK